MALTHSEFAQQAAYLASRCATWAGECADNFGKPGAKMRDDSVERFVALLRERADLIERAHGESKDGQ